ncbi:MAG: hypothetical protein QW100_00625 [Thermoplasmatales archaeon]
MKGIPTAILIGIAFMIIALIIESAIESIPALLEILKYGTKDYVTKLASFELLNPVVYSVFIGLAAGVSQETMKYIAVDTRGKELAFWIGLGFAIVDIVFLMSEELLSGSLYRLTAKLIILTSLNIVFSLLFHPGTAEFLKAGRIIGKGIYYLAETFLIHGLVDGGLVYADIEAILHPHETLIIILYWALAFPVSIAMIIVGSYYLSKSKEVKSVDATVF